MATTQVATVTGISPGAVAFIVGSYFALKMLKPVLALGAILGLLYVVEKYCPACSKGLTLK